MNTDIHRLLDEAFDGIAMTPETRELKEEVRANLMARATELEAAGSSPAHAARTAIAELGPVEDLLGTAADVRTTNRDTVSAAELHARNKVRANPGFVVRTTLLSVGATASAAPPKARKKRKLSADARRRIAEAQKRRWAKARAGKE